eukprot:scaffold31612_cov69-Attheya_sp.AAC.1
MATEAAAVRERNNGWVTAAATFDIDLMGAPLNDPEMMAQIYTKLNITEIGPRTQLNGYIRRLQNQQQP